GGHDVEPVAAGLRRPHRDAASAPAGRGRPALPAVRQRAAVRRAARAAPRGGVRPLSRGVASDGRDGTARPAHRHPRARARLVRRARGLTARTRVAPDSSFGAASQGSAGTTHPVTSEVSRSPMTRLTTLALAALALLCACSAALAATPKKGGAYAGTTSQD